MRSCREIHTSVNVVSKQFLDVVSKHNITTIGCLCPRQDGIHQGPSPAPFFTLIFSPSFVSSVLIVWLQDEADELTDLAGN